MDERAIRKSLAGLWKKYLPEMGERVGVLERACASLCAGKLSAEERAAALGAAHKLAGALGTFGRGRGTELAREVESLLQNPGAEQAHDLKSRIAELRAIVRRG